MLSGIVRLIYHCGDVSDEVPPVLIPNTEVKLISAENTLSETIRENRSLLHPKEKALNRYLLSAFSLFVYVYYNYNPKNTDNYRLLPFSEKISDLIC